MAQKKKDEVMIRILPLKGIGGVGNAGTVAPMDRVQAEQYRDEGYLEIIEEEEPVVVQSNAADRDPEASVDDAKAEDAAVEDHAIMKPENKRS